MANTYTQIYIHLIFAVSGGTNLIKNEWKDELYKFITGIVRNDKQKLIAINGVGNHVHLLIGLKPDMALSTLFRDVKACSSKFINEKGYCKNKFNGQEGFGAFSYSQSQLNVIEKYIKNQVNHHKKKTFREEYIGFLKKYKVDYDERYIFEIKD
ncbi:MAG: transposase [Ignavibacteria bacterium]|jgi:REP element-mobilizing transposase RayT